MSEWLRIVLAMHIGAAVFGLVYYRESGRDVVRAAAFWFLALMVLGMVLG